MRRLPKGILILILIISTAPCPAQRKVKENALTLMLFRMERRVIWDAVVKKEMKVLNYFLADDYLDVSDVGVFTKQETLKLIPDLEISSYSLSDFKLIILNNDAAIVTYSAVQHWKIQGKEAPSNVRASSTWVRRGGRWRVVFHQESTLK
jgi:hypothetical protein